VSALQGLIAKEQVVSSLSVIAGGDILAGFPFFTSNKLAAYSFICFNLFSLPCFGALAAMKKELGSRKALFQAIGVELLWSFSLSSVIGLIGWASTGWAAPEIEGFGPLNGSYVGATWLDGLLLALTLLVVGLIVYFHWIRPRIHHTSANCHDTGEGNKARLLVDAYHHEKAKAEKKANSDKTKSM
jgi:hypothetical protein